MRHSIILSLTVCVLVVSIHAQTDSISVRIIKDKENFIKHEPVWLAVEAVNNSSRDVRFDVGVFRERFTFIRNISDTLWQDSIGSRWDGGWLVKAGDTSSAKIDFTNFESREYGMYAPGDYQLLLSTDGHFEGDSSGQSMNFSDSTTFSIRPLSGAEEIIVDSIRKLVRVMYSRELSEAEIEFIESYRNDEIYIVLLYEALISAMNGMKPLMWTEFVCEFIRSYPDNYYAIDFAGISLYMEPNYEGLHDKVIEAGRNAPSDSRIYLWLVKKGFIVEEE